MIHIVDAVVHAIPDTHCLFALSYLSSSEQEIQT